MSLPIALAALLLVGLVVAVVTAPLRSAERAPAQDAAQAAAQEAAERAAEELRELEAERDAKYAEIRDAELDWRTGKLSPEDYAAVDAALRAEAIGILDRIGAAGGQTASSTPAAGREQPPADASAAPMRPAPAAAPDDPPSLERTPAPSPIAGEKP